MGIRFSCPNGHRLNVKAFLAGKRAKCPQCGAKVRVPTGTNSPDDEEDLATVVVASARPAFPVEATASESKTDSGELLPAPWFIRLPNGEQFGPASEDEMSDWVRQGRVPSDAWVWREGWTDWQPASSGLPLRSDGPPPVPPQVSTLLPAVKPVELSSNGELPRRRWKQNKHEQNILVSGILGVATVILLVILVWILVKAN